MISDSLINIVRPNITHESVSAVKSLDECRLYTFVDAAHLHGRNPAVVAQQLCDGGSDLIQLRAKNLPPGEVRRWAEAIQPITRRAGVWLVINDHLEIARSVGAEICHLGQEDFFDSGFTRVSQVRGSHSALRVGLSTHAPAQCGRAIAAGADYVAIGPVYPTGTKPTAKPVTLDYVRWAAANVKVPWFAIGGINLSTVGDVLEAGAQRICVVSAILNTSDIAGECQKFRARIESAAKLQR